MHKNVIKMEEEVKKFFCGAFLAHFGQIVAHLEANLLATPTGPLATLIQSNFNEIFTP